MKKGIVGGLLLGMLLMLSPMRAEAAEVVDSGNQENVAWTFYDNGHLYVDTTELQEKDLSIPAWKQYQKEITSVEIVGSGAINTNSWFTGYENLVSVDTDEWNTENVTDMGYMFSGCKALKDIDASHWDMRKVTDIQAMFYDCTSLTELDLSNWEFENLENMPVVFTGCTGLVSLNVDGWDITGVSNLSGVFAGCSALTSLDLSGWKTDFIGNTDNLFSECSNLVNLSLPDWDFSNVGNAIAMFYNCKSLKQLPELDAASLVICDYMFYDCENLSTTISMCQRNAIYTCQEMFAGAATAKDAAIYLRYNSTLEGYEAEKIIATKTENSHVYLAPEVQLVRAGWVADERVQMEVGETYELQFVVEPANANAMVVIGEELLATVDGTNSNMMVYSLDKYGRKLTVLPAKEGIAHLTFHVYDGDRNDYFHDSIVLEVGDVSSCTSVAGVILEEEEVTLDKVGDSVQLHARVFPETATNQNIIWSVGGYGYEAEVSDTGFVTAKTNGQLRIWATSEEGGYSDSCGLIINDPDFVEVEATGLTINPSPVLLTEIGESVQLNAVYTPENTTRKDLHFYSLDDSVATVDDKGVVTAVSQGTTTIQAYINASSVSYDCQVTVDTSAAPVKNFVERMYTVALNRKADVSGVNYWTQLLLNGGTTGGDVANGFFLGEEFVDRNLSDEAYVEVLYATFFDREADAEGLKYYKDLLVSDKENGRNSALDVFIQSTEFNQLCGNYGIIAFVSNEQKVKQFVERMYTVALNRTAEESGVNYWTELLLGGKTDAEDVARGFFTGEEFVKRALDDAAYVKTLYATFFDREADDSGLYYNLNLLRSDPVNGRTKVFDVFASSDEFKKLCESYGIKAMFSREEQVRSFVERMYTVALNRAAEEDGASYWTNELLAGNTTGAQVAQGFINGEEFKGRGLNDRDYVITLYGTFFDREAQEEDIAYWEGVAAKDRDAVLVGFANSDEFAKLCESYGIVRGEL